MVATKAKLRLQYWWIGGVQNGYLVRDNLAMVSLVALFSDGELNVEGNVPELAGAGVGVELELVPWVHFYHLGGEDHDETMLYRKHSLTPIELVRNNNPNDTGWLKKAFKFFI